MAAYYVVCITKHPTNREPHRQVEWIGTSEDPNDAWATRQWSVPQVIEAIRGGDRFYCTVQSSAATVRVVVAERSGTEYIKTDGDDLYRDNLLTKRECILGS
ncbi:MAG TPA: DUF3892 domain-containing protein [bacterium]|nr:DUF3892 domain-containing protein [bacterium]